MSLSGVILSFKTGTYDVYRVAASEPVNGRYAPGAATIVPMDACVQPVPGDVLQTLPEGQHATKMKMVFTQSELHSREAGYEPDVIVIRNEPYEVFRCELWEAFGGDTSGDHWMSVVALKILPKHEGELAKTLGTLAATAAGTVV